MREIVTLRINLRDSPSRRTFIRRGHIICRSNTWIKGCLPLQLALLSFNTKCIFLEMSKCWIKWMPVSHRVRWGLCFVCAACKTPWSPSVCWSLLSLSPAPCRLVFLSDGFHLATLDVLSNQSPDPVAPITGHRLHTAALLHNHVYIGFHDLGDLSNLAT